MNNWMTRLADHFDQTRRRFTHDTLMILFDIDGTIVDMRHLIQDVLQEYDNTCGTAFFSGLRIEDITVHENHVDQLLEQLDIPLEEHQRILDFWHTQRWQPESLMKSHRPFSGVMDVIRWFQMQPNVVVGLNTGRPERLRDDTLRSLNALGEGYRVSFKSEHLHMNSQDWEEGVAASKVEGVHRFQREGYKVFAVVDNEPANLAAVAAFDKCQEILPLHAHTIFESERSDLPYCSISGSDYVLSDLAREDALPRDVQFVWHGVNDTANLRQFLGSDIKWGELDVRTDPRTRELILHHDSLDIESDDAPLLELETVFTKLIKYDKSIKFDLKENGSTVNGVMKLLDARPIDESRLWFNGEIDVLSEQGFRKLRDALPSAVIQCPINPLAERVLNDPVLVRKRLEELESWGVSRFSVKWRVPEIGRVLECLKDWGFEINIYHLPDLDSFLHAVLLKPHSITSDFNFPQWHYFGRGSGENGRYHSYEMEHTPTTVS